MKFCFKINFIGVSALRGRLKYFRLLVIFTMLTFLLTIYMYGIMESSNQFTKLLNNYDELSVKNELLLKKIILVKLKEKSWLSHMSSRDAKKN
jgi:hypothetical protein